MYGDSVPRFIWEVAWILSLTSLLILSLLIAVRYLRESREAAYAARYAELQRMLLIHLETPLSELRQTFVQQKYDFDILANLAQKILRTVSGRSRARIHSFIQVLALEQRVYQQAKQGNKRERLAAIRLIGYLPVSEKRTEILIEVLGNEADSQLRYTAAESLSKLGDVNNLPSVIAALQQIELLSPLLIYDIFQRFGPKSCELLVHTANDTAADNIRIAAIRALGGIPGNSSQEVLLAHCYSNQPEVSATAYQALSRLALPIPVVTIRHGCQQPFWKVRMYTADCAEHAEDFPIESLQCLLDDTNWMVSIHAASALYSWGDAGRRILKMIATQESIAAKRANAFLEETDAQK